MKFSKKDIKADYLGEPLTPYPPEEEGQKEISIYHPSYEYLVKLVKVISKTTPEAIPEIKALSQAFPFKTVDDIGDLTIKIWTLATTKYNIPREWLMKQLPEKEANLKKADLWPAQEEASEGTLTQGPGQIAYNPT